MNGICLYDRGSDSFRTLSNNGKPIYVASYLLVEGGILLGGSGAIYKYVYATNKLEPLYYAQDPVYYNPFWQMIRYDEENILLNSRWHGIYSFNMKTYEVKKIESFTENNYTSIYLDSYKRLWGGAEAPSYICWGHNNRSALLRIPQYKPGKGNSARMEFRALDPVANPYLAYSVLLAAGLDGIDKQMQLGEPTSDDVWELTDAERQAMGIQPLPESLDEALKIMEKSDFVADVLGEHAFEYFLRNKHQEWDEYRKQVTPFELKKYLPKL